MTTAKLISKFNPFTKDVSLKDKHMLFFGIVTPKGEWVWNEVTTEYAREVGHETIFEQLETKMK